MNIFILDNSPVVAAQLQCDKHVVKMIVESAQMLSTAHRMIDGIQSFGPSKSGKRTVAHYRHPDTDMDNTLYKVVHASHPCTKWTMISSCNYEWHYQHFIALCDEYRYRYNRQHSTDVLLRTKLKQHPKYIPKKALTLFPLAMKSNPECMFEDDPVKSYRMFYQTKQDRFKMAWSKRNVPEWFHANVHN
jgi:hypothetical protein